MCTAISYGKNKRLFGRNLDLEGSFGEGVIVAPRNLKLPFRCEGTSETHYAMIGMGIVQDGMPLYFDAINEYGLGMAGLNFPKNAVYFPKREGKRNVAPFEIIPFVLAGCKTVEEARALLEGINLVDIPFSEKLPLTPLHWQISDMVGSIVVEQTSEGLRIYDNPTGTLTNNPPFPMQLNRLSDYMSLTPEEPKARVFGGAASNYSRGMGSIGLPGDFASAGRFVRACFVRETLVTGSQPMDEICGFFHILESVAVPRGCMCLREGVYEETVYSSCCDLEEGVYYYTTYTNPAIHAVKMRSTDLEGTMPVFYPLQKQLEIAFDN